MPESHGGANELSRSAGMAVLVMVVCLTAVVVLAGCSGTSDPTPLPNLIRSDRERAEPTTTDAELAALVDGNSAFAFDLYQALRARDGNLFYSPHSISLALGMVYAGARGQTASQMAETLHLPPGDRLHPAFNALARELAARTGRDQEFRLSIVNAVWGQEGHEFRQAFLDLLAESYGAGVGRTDFRGAPEEARGTINKWIAENTENRIKELLPSDVITPLTRMVLTNAIYFKSAWSFPFNQADTRDRPFHLLDGRIVDVPMMAMDEELLYGEGAGYQAVDLPYVGNELSMTIVLPELGRFEEFEDSLDAAFIDRLMASFEGRQVELDLPRFEFESQFRLADVLRTMGMSDAFDIVASDFSGMDGRSCLAGDPECLYLLDVIHKSFVSVDEAGTEAAAATAAVMVQESAPPPRVAMTVDRPFIFLIRDRATEAILFVGRVAVI